MKKRWLFIPLTVGLLALVATSGAIFAQGNAHPGGGGAVKGLASRVEETLDLDEETVQTASTRLSGNTRMNTCKPYLTG
jgi:hypothetical protein